MNIFKRRTISAVWMGIAVIIGPMAAHAFELGGSGIDSGKISLGGRAMFFDPKDADDGDLYGGAQARFHFTPAIAAEGSIDYRRSYFGPTRVHVYPVQASLLFHLMPGKAISPFLIGGGGWYYTQVDGPGGQDDRKHRFGTHAGAGLQAFLNKYWSLDATYRYVWVEKINSRNAALLNKDYTDSGSMITAGLNYHF